MQEHPIPQDVTGYKFHIVGNMTLKQFAQVGAGVFLAVIIYNTNLLIFVKWPLIVLAVGLGGMMAFVPIEERPLDHWITTFFRRLYSPTKFYWRKENSVPFAMEHKKTVAQTVNPTFEIDLTPARTERIRQYIASVKQPAAAEPWESEENSRVAKILNAFDQVVVEETVAKPQNIRPQLTTRVRKLAAVPKPPQTTQTIFQSAEAQTPTAPATNLPSPELEPVPSETETQLAPDQPQLEKPPQMAVNTNATLPFPQKELAPNKIVGMVLTKDNKLVDRAVVRILDTKDKVAGAFNTNLLGQFFASTPFPNGTYTIAVEKAGLEFPRVSLTLSGAVVEPLELRAV
jgi:hypothetical protein